VKEHAVFCKTRIHNRDEKKEKKNVSLKKAAKNTAGVVFV
jgi:hypothetical protein